LSTTADTVPEADRPLDHPHLIPPLDVTLGHYRVSFARTESELDALRRLRFEVFNLELGEGFEESFATGRDEDRFDAQCQHLVVTFGDGREVVGTYRMQIADAALAGQGFSSDAEFALESLPDEVLATSVELGRACIAKAHRSRSVLFLLWRGLWAYLMHTGKQRCFGCSSLTSQDMAEGLRFHRQLEQQGKLHPTLRVEPRASHACHAEDIEGPEVATPKLFHTYLRHGAYVLGPPAIDRDFGTIDWLTMIEANEEHGRVFGG
jgi:putative hemolysin